MQSLTALFLISILLSSFSMIPLIYAQTIDKQTIQGNESDILPTNSSAFMKPVPKGPCGYYFTKYVGYDMTIADTVKNPIELSGNVTDPNGIIHQMQRADLGNGTIQITYHATSSDPVGTYSACINFVEGSQTKVISFGASFNEPLPTVGHVGMRLPSMALATPAPISPLQQIKQGVSPDKVWCFYGNMILMKKLSDNSPACVTEETAHKLVERGWGLIIIHQTHLSYP